MDEFDDLSKRYGLVFDDAAIREVFDHAETVVIQKAQAASEAIGRPRDEAMMSAVGMLLLYRSTRNWLRVMERLWEENGGDYGHQIAEVIREQLPAIDEDVDKYRPPLPPGKLEDYDDSDPFDYI